MRLFACKYGDWNTDCSSILVGLEIGDPEEGCQELTNATEAVEMQGVVPRGLSAQGSTLQL